MHVRKRMGPCHGPRLLQYFQLHNRRLRITSPKRMKVASCQENTCLVYMVLRPCHMTQQPQVDHLLQCPGQLGTVRHLMTSSSIFPVPWQWLGLCCAMLTGWWISFWNNILPWHTSLESATMPGGAGATQSTDTHFLGTNGPKCWFFTKVMSHGDHRCWRQH